MRLRPLLSMAAAGCAARDVPLDRLESDVASAATTPNASFVLPDRCHDGHDATCADGYTR